MAGQGQVFAALLLGLASLCFAVPVPRPDYYRTEYTYRYYIPPAPAYQQRQGAFQQNYRWVPAAAPPPPPQQRLPQIWKATPAVTKSVYVVVQGDGNTDAEEERQLTDTIRSLLGEVALGNANAPGTAPGTAPVRGTAATPWSTSWGAQPTFRQPPPTFRPPPPTFRPPPPTFRPPPPLPSQPPPATSTPVVVKQPTDSPVFNDEAEPDFSKYHWQQSGGDSGSESEADLPASPASTSQSDDDASSSHLEYPVDAAAPHSNDDPPIDVRSGFSVREKKRLRMNPRATGSAPIVF